MLDSGDIPFNIKLLSLTPQKLSGIKPVTSLDIFDGATGNLHEEGLFSISIFGKPGDEKRDLRFSYIDIKAEVFHPIIYFSLRDLKSLYEKIMSGEEYAVFNPVIHDFEKSNPIDGETGYSFFLSHWKEIEFHPSKSDLRQDQAKLVERNKAVALTNKIAVMPAGLRDIEIGDDGRIRKDEVNDIYFRILSIANTIQASTIETNPKFLDNARYKLQINFNNLYNMLEGMIKGKRKLFLNKWASRKIQNGTRNVITAMKVNNPVLGAAGNIGFNSTLVGLYQAMKAALPITRYELKNSIIARIFQSPEHPITVVDPKSLHQVQMAIDVALFDRWTTDEGLDKLITDFSEPTHRAKPILIGENYLALIYKGKDGTFRLIQDIDELPNDRLLEDVTPLTWIEFFYIATQKRLNALPAFVTRYPITGIGSIYPSLTYVKTTVHFENRIPLDDNWMPMDESERCYQYPVIGSAYVNAVSPHTSRISKLGADYDGDGFLN